MLAFLVVSAVLIVVPGQDTALMIRNTVVGGRPAGLSTAGGVATAQVVWTAATAAGLAALLVAWRPAFDALRVLGAAYLLFLGARMLRDAFRARSHGAGAACDRRAHAAPRLPAGPAQQPQQPEDGRVLHEPAAAVRRHVRGRGRPRRDLRRDDARRG